MIEQQRSIRMVKRRCSSGGISPRSVASAKRRIDVRGPSTSPGSKVSPWPSICSASSVRNLPENARPPHPLVAEHDIAYKSGTTAVPDPRRLNDCLGWFGSIVLLSAAACRRTTLPVRMSRHRGGSQAHSLLRSVRLVNSNQEYLSAHGLRGDEVFEQSRRVGDLDEPGCS